MARPQETAKDELLGRLVVGIWGVSLYRHAGAVLSKLSAHELPDSRLRRFPQEPVEADDLLDCAIEQGAIQSLLGSSPPPVIEISGSPGSGKTALVRSIPGLLYIDAGGLTYAEVLQRLYERAFTSEMRYVPDLGRLHEIFAGWVTPVVLDDFSGSAIELHTVIEVLKYAPVIYTTIDPLHLDPSVAEIRLAGLRAEAACKLFERYYGAPILGKEEVIDLVSSVLGGNPLAVAQAGALARSGHLLMLQGPETLAAAIFNNMTIVEQQILVTIAAYEESRPQRETVEFVSGVAKAGLVIDAMIARHAVQTDGERLWLSQCMTYPVLAVMRSLMRYDLMFAYANDVLSRDHIFSSVVENSTPFLVSLRLAASRGLHEQVVTTGRALADALLLAGLITAARESCELVRIAAYELNNQVMQAWAYHQLGTLAAFLDEHDEAVSALTCAVSLREREHDEKRTISSRKNLALLLGKPLPRKSKPQKVGIKHEFKLIAFAMLLSVLGMIGYTQVWQPYLSPSVVRLARRHTSRQADVNKIPAVRTSAVKASAVKPSAVKVAVVASNQIDTPPAQTLPVARPPIRVIVPAPVSPPLFFALPWNITAPRVAFLPRPRRQVDRVGRPALGPLSRSPRIAQFTTSAPRIVVGQYTSLCFKLLNATSAFLEPLGKLSVAHSGCVNASPHMDTYYTLYAYNNNGMATASVHVGVLPTEALPRSGVGRMP